MTDTQGRNDAPKRSHWSSQDSVETLSARLVSRFELLGTQPAEMTVAARSIVEAIDVIGHVGYGHLLDVACGTGYWLPHYVGNCSSVTLFDQSERMLAECERKVRRLPVGDRCSLVRGDVFDHEFAPSAHDCALVGFLLSHVSEEQEHLVMQALRETLRPGASFLILESAWTDLRARFNQKVERQNRRLNDGTEFKIYKRYISREDIQAWERNYGVRTTIEHFGEALCAVSAAFTEVPA